MYVRFPFTLFALVQSVTNIYPRWISSEHRTQKAYAHIVIQSHSAIKRKLKHTLCSAQRKVDAIFVAHLATLQTRTQLWVARIRTVFIRFPKYLRPIANSYTLWSVISHVGNCLEFFKNDGHNFKSSTKWNRS